MKEFLCGAAVLAIEAGAILWIIWVAGNIL